MPIYPLRVLVLEDHLFQRSVVVRMLRRLGCEHIFEAADGAEALAVLHRVGPVDIALCDLQMEGMDGLEFLQNVADSGLVGAIIISSSISADLRRTVKQIIAVLGLDLLGDAEKPLQYEVLEGLLKKCLAKPFVKKKPMPEIELPSEAEVRRAMAQKEFRAYFQPKFHLETGEVKGVEVLTRWQHPTRGLLSPIFFLPVLERGGLLDELLFEQLRQSLDLQGQAKRQGHSLDFAFNLHAMQLANSHLADQIKVLLAEFSLLGSSLTFELTESGLLEAPAVSLESLFRLRMMGCSLSIDDFGAGFSSLQRLCQLPFNEIKLDAEFVRPLVHEPRCRAVVSSTLALGKTLGMSVVVEGIETNEQRMMLLELGCTLGQGYLFARPMGGADLLQLLENLSVGEDLSRESGNSCRKILPFLGLCPTYP